MQKMKKILFLILVVLWVGVASAQDNSFLLYSVKGNVSVIENKVESKAKIGKTLNGDAVIKVPTGAMATLICDEAAMFTLSKPGSYTLSKLTDSCSSHTGSVSSNYVRYVWNQMTHTSSSPGSNRKAFMNNVGAVTRDVYPVWIDPRLDTVNYTGSDFPLTWKCFSDVKEFQFLLYNPDNLDKAIFTKMVDKVKIPISSIQIIKPGNSYRWVSFLKDQPAETPMYRVLNYVTKEQYEKVLNAIKAQGAPGESPAEQAYRVGFLLEDAHYLAEAYQYYTKANTLDPNNGLYFSTLMLFRKDYEIKADKN